MLRILLVVATTVAAGCSSAQITVRSTYADHVAPVKSVMVLEAMRSGGAHGFNGLMHRGFDKQLRSELDGCRVRYDIRPGSLSKQDDPAVEAAVRAFGPDAVLKIQHWGGDTHVTVNQYDEAQSSSSDLSFMLELVDLRSTKVTWRVEMQLQVKSGSGIADGEKFAEAVMAQLRRDGVFAACGG